MFILIRENRHGSIQRYEVVCASNDYSYVSNVRYECVKHILETKIDNFLLEYAKDQDEFSELYSMDTLVAYKELPDAMRVCFENRKLVCVRFNIIEIQPNE